jgi:hypothetical protein
VRRSKTAFRWLQVGTAAAGVSVGLAAVPAIASADDGGAASATGPKHSTSQRVGATNRQSGRAN